ncbi:cytochrome c biogenesis protein CcdA [Thermoleophilia bacterium SCSIO 60948]|nr:cytochrome c biogenesis protein CcdA [Thermoleophilia bacterium SCSIO 60948]
MPADPSVGVGVLAAVLAGFVSFLSPCVLPLVPGYLSAVSGVLPSDLERARVWTVLRPALLFVAAFSAIFILLGLTATSIGGLLRDNIGWLTDVAAVLIIVMGLLFVLSPFVPRLGREWHSTALLARAGKGGPLIAGAAFAIAWTPCIGPTLGAILTAASLSDSVARGGLLLAAYSAGLAIPFLITAVAFGQASTAFGVVKRHYRAIVVFGGLVLIAMGLAILTGEFERLNQLAQGWTSDLGLNL